ncbi:hypothetical protein ACFYOT_26640 [Saccharothrix saharensis]|uniref:hypothetical protein n=1 Tax=Saccharothrix saharensis TaxID=571190 RepID=UPI0036B7F00C
MPNDVQPTLSGLRASPAGQGAPEEALRLVNAARDVPDAVERLTAAGFVQPVAEFAMASHRCWSRVADHWTPS